MIMVVMILFNSSYKNETAEVCGNTNLDTYCIPGGPLSTDAQEGKRVFNTNCAACHQLDRAMTGPALRDIGKVHDTITIVKFLHGEKTTIDNPKFNNNCIKFPQLSTEEIRQILEYTDH